MAPKGIVSHNAIYLPSPVRAELTDGAVVEIIRFVS
jgi:hypothetical protein